MGSCWRKFLKRRRIRPEDFLKFLRLLKKRVRNGGIVYGLLLSNVGSRGCRGPSNEEVTSKELTESVLGASERWMKISGFITLLTGRGAAGSRKIDQPGIGSASRSAGIPMALKDNLCTRGVPTTCAPKYCKAVARHMMPVLWKLKQSRTILMGKANMDEFAMGSSTENSAFLRPVIPGIQHELSSAGIGSAGCREKFFALGSDTGGSVRQPASLCGVVGLKPMPGSFPLWPYCFAS